MTKLPQIGDPAPSFEVETPRGTFRFPDYAHGSWCVFFAHPANFTSAWTIFSAFLARKERALNESNTKVLALSNYNIGQNDWSDKARRFIGIYLKAPVIEDLDQSIAKMYGLASTRRPQPNCNRLALILDPEGIIRFIYITDLNVGRCVDEVLRVLEAQQNGGLMPCGWRPGQAAIKAG